MNKKFVIELSLPTKHKKIVNQEIIDLVTMVLIFDQNIDIIIASDHFLVTALSIFPVDIANHAKVRFIHSGSSRIKKEFSKNIHNFSFKKIDLVKKKANFFLKI
tara:strand:- start:4734 stop:5045 length:312 start_codon:yes stop_codon:yes gene_type:complete